MPEPLTLILALPQPFWRRGSGRVDLLAATRLVALLVIEVVLLVVLLVLVGTVVIPLAAPRIETSVPAS